jgi:glycosyltransferase involved in cell wall biosynthesis
MMTDNLKISIIVPVYNSQKTIQRCCDSLLNQTYKNIEIILVNDGSKDESLKIINSYECKYDNVIVLNQKNSGAGAARNNGLLKASGEYVTFVDSDDELSKDAIKNMVKCLKPDTDIVISGFKEFDNKGNILIDMIPKKNYWTEFKFTSTMFKLYRKKYLIDNNVKFAHFNVFEDLYFCLCAYSRSNNIEINSNQDYIIYKNADSITSNFENRPLQDCKNVLEALNKNVNFYKYSNSTVEFFYLKTLVLNIVVQLDGHNLNDLNNIYINDYNWLKSLKITSKPIKFHWQKYEDFSINFAVNLFNFMTKIHLNKFLIFVLKRMKKIRFK